VGGFGSFISFGVHPMRCIEQMCACSECVGCFGKDLEEGPHCMARRLSREPRPTWEARCCQEETGGW
jgi:hypothetical protein